MKLPSAIANPARRSCLSWIGFSLPLLWAFPFGRATQASTSTAARQLLKSGLEDIVGDLSGAGQIGSIYLAAHPYENNFDLLAGDIMDASLLGDRYVLKQRISTLRVRDFANEDMTTIDGWVLARIEARICALVHIL